LKKKKEINNINYFGTNTLQIKENHHLNIYIPEFKEIDNSFYIDNNNSHNKVKFMFLTL
jgi:hypothetical protein